jgi:DNA mismatch endonuclease (patch repair protein)
MRCANSNTSAVRHKNVREATTKSMQSNVPTDTTIEIALRRELWRLGARGYRKNHKGLPGSPDIAFTRQKFAVFVHGCFWHRCPTCSRNLSPATNKMFWTLKFEQNAERDARNEKRLRGLGYKVFIAWECAVRSNPTRLARSILKALGKWTRNQG